MANGRRSAFRPVRLAIRGLAVGLWPWACLAAACSSASSLSSPQAFPGAMPVVSETVIAGGIPWSAERRLTWSDFVGTPQVSSPAGAVTFYVMNYQSECTGDAFSFKVWSAFLPRRSWVKSALLMEPYQGSLALQHEQTHFDISEVHARKLRRSLAALPDACDRPQADVNAVVSRHMALDSEIQRRYDRETGHGSRLREQAQWDADVRAELRALEKYAQ